MSYRVHVCLAAALRFVGQAEGMVGKDQLVRHLRDVLAESFAEPGHDFGP